MRALPAAPRSRFGSYEVVGALGQGGMAEVWQAVHRSPSGACRPVALKRMRADLRGDDNALRMFRAEQKLSARLQHPNIVRVLDDGELDGQPFIAFELIDGVELRRLIREHKRPLPFGFTVHVVQQLAEALAYAHQLTDEAGQWLRIVHRDISPSNVMVDFSGNIKLFDFGVARARREDGSETTFGVAKGKIGYMAPEVAAGKPFDARGDLFSLGVVLHEMLTARRLFSDKDERVALLLNRNARATPPSQANPAVPPMLDEIALRALKRDPDERYQRAADMAADLARAQAAMPWTLRDTIELLDDFKMPQMAAASSERLTLPRQTKRALRRAMPDAPTVARPAPAAAAVAVIAASAAAAGPRRATAAVLLVAAACALAIAGMVRWQREHLRGLDVVAPSRAAPLAARAPEPAPPSSPARTLPAAVPPSPAASEPAPTVSRAPTRARPHARAATHAHATPALQGDRLFNPFDPRSR